MKGKILSYRRGRHTQKTNQILVQVSGIESKEQANKLVGKKVIWTTKTGKKRVGKVSSTHGSKGVVRARFSQGLPGQAINTEVLIE